MSSCTPPPNSDSQRTHLEMAKIDLVHDAAGRTVHAGGLRMPRSVYFVIILQIFTLLQRPTLRFENTVLTLLGSAGWLNEKKPNFVG